MTRSPEKSRSVLALVMLFCAFVPAAFGAAAFRPMELRCEDLRNPLGIDTVQPRLSWVLQPEGGRRRGQRQTAYQVLVASSRKKLDANQGDLWDTGKVCSDQSVHLRYQGLPLASEQECFWKVRAWDLQGRVSAWSEPAHWSMGLLTGAEWQANWIGWEEVEPKTILAGTSWIWFPEGHAEQVAPLATRWFRRAFDLPPGRKIKSARWQVSGDDQFTALVNGHEVGTGANFKTAMEFNVDSLLRSGKNVLAASVKNLGEAPNPAGFVGLLQILFEDGESLVVATDETWQSSAGELPGWRHPDYDDSTWLPARKLGPVGMEPWGEVAGSEERRLPARWLRKQFRIDKQVRRAVVYISGLGLSEFYLNGEKVGDHVLSPGLTEYSKRSFYVTHDVTKCLRSGPNAIGVILGNGRYFAPRRKVPTETRTYGFPKLRFELRVEYTDGSKASIVSDQSWKLTTNGPIRANNEYDGEEYDARMEMLGWSEAGYDDSGWHKPQLVDAPGGLASAQMIKPIRVTQTLQPVAVTQPKPGVFIFDLGQNLVGWCRLTVSGPRGTTVSLRHAENLKPDGTLYLDNLRSAKVTDTYILKGEGREVYEPRFTYHGFRYVEVTGYPGVPTLSSLAGRVVNDDLESAGEFVCSHPLLNRIYQNILWGSRGNYRSIPTDCPQRDERQGWLGDRSAESRGESYLFQTAAFYRKWLQDIADAQKKNGSVPDVCPPYWPFYSDNVTWPSSTVMIPGALYEQYGDTAVLENHYDSAKQWMDYMYCFVTNGIIARDNYGDWCVPPEDPQLIHSNDPKRKTDKALLATAYFYKDALLMAQYAKVLGKPADVKHFQMLAEELNKAFNDKFYNAEAGYYDNGSQTSCVLPLAFGLVPPEHRERLLRRLLTKIREESRDHIGTGLIGGQWLMRVLSDNGHADVAFKIAAQKTYPSWGYMVERGATTIWELWNGDTADPGMNSGNHLMLVGDLTTWLFEYLAGIKPDPQQPGFKRIIMKPELLGDLCYVRATHRSPFGLILSEWKRESGTFSWNISIPVNTTAIVYVPAEGVETIRENGRPVKRAKGVRFLGTKAGRALFELASGNYHFEASRQ
ncbi:MAG TPA: family 78 glycoside hydrolase catalytic domain [Clostridia bacterium]|nr:family 78 glycoside hydrolase catalytic domain [Clostridia bacterium]